MGRKEKRTPLKGPVSKMAERAKADLPLSPLLPSRNSLGALEFLSVSLTSCPLRHQSRRTKQLRMEGVLAVVFRSLLSLGRTFALELQISMKSSDLHGLRLSLVLSLGRAEKMLANINKLTWVVLQQSDQETCKGVIPWVAKSLHQVSHDDELMHF